jgi:formate/nitrite transporter FocA (FNT family)
MCAYSAAAWCERRISLLSAARLCAVTWVGNFMGAALFLGLYVATGMFEGREWYAVLLAQKKARGAAGPLQGAWRGGPRTLCARG